MSAPTLSPGLSITLTSPLPLVFEAFSNATRLCEWLCYDAQIDAKTDGRLYLYWRDPSFYAMGVFTEVIENERLSFTWQDKDRPSPTSVEIHFQASEDQTTIAIYHEGGMSDQLKTLWENGFDALEATQRCGYHPSLTERPMLGVLIGGLVTKDNAAQFSVPIQHGLFLMGTVPGLSAERVGLRKGDVIASLAGEVMDSLGTMGEIVKQYKAGDVIDLVYYRGAEQVETKMELKARPLHPYPETSAALASWYQEQHAGVWQELKACFEAASEEAAARKPAPEAWSAAEVVAHLILAERDFQTFVTSLVIANELEVFSSNDHARVQALSKRYGSAQALLQALKETQEENLALLAGLNQDFLLRKASVVRLQLLAESNPYHIRHHIGQIQRALATT